MSNSEQRCETCGFGVRQSVLRYCQSKEERIVGINYETVCIRGGPVSYYGTDSKCGSCHLSKSDTPDDIICHYYPNSVRKELYGWCGQWKPR